MHLIWFLLVGLIAGWLAGKLTKGSGFGVLGDIVIGAVGSVSGNVVDETGRPVGGLEVVWKIAVDFESLNGGVLPGGVTNEAGKFILQDMPAGRVSLSARGMGWTSEWSLPITVHPGAETEGINRLVPRMENIDLVSLTGSAGELKPLTDRLPLASRLETGKLLGRSLAMGGLAMVSHILALPAGRNGLHLAASPEGPYFAIDFHGGATVQP